jgi:hypothetical protein
MPDGALCLVHIAASVRGPRLLWPGREDKPSPASAATRHFLDSATNERPDLRTGS